MKDGKVKKIKTRHARDPFRLVPCQNFTNEKPVSILCNWNIIQAVISLYSSQKDLHVLMKFVACSWGLVRWQGHVLKLPRY